MDELGDGERILAQTAALSSARGDLDTVALLRAVRRLDFTQTDDGDVTESTCHGYFWAAVFYVEDVDCPALEDDVLAHVLPTLVEVRDQNQRTAVNQIAVRPLLTKPDADWRQSLATTTAPPPDTRTKPDHRGHSTAHLRRAATSQPAVGRLSRRR
ncbi:hypothetical protein [Kitasatospora sp. NPDC098663]|uniref:hypothetical protein n=1 Tax=Kitasatospora sp. NPDC098663 TaxID=3364096 RepID=UPI0037F81B8E